MENFYLHNRGDYVKMNKEMEIIGWNEELKDKDVNEMWETFKSIVHDNMSS